MYFKTFFFFFRKSFSHYLLDLSKPGVQGKISNTGYIFKKNELQKMEVKQLKEVNERVSKIFNFLVKL